MTLLPAVCPSARSRDLGAEVQNEARKDIGPDGSVIAVVLAPDDQAHSRAWPSGATALHHIGINLVFRSLSEPQGKIRGGSGQAASESSSSAWPSSGFIPPGR